MANLGQLVFPVIITFVLLTFLSFTVNNWSPHICNTIVTQEKTSGRIYRTSIRQEDNNLNDNPNMGHSNRLSQISQESVFRAATCQEDLQHIYEIENTNVKTTSSSQLTEILYKSVTRPVQGNIHGKHDEVKKHKFKVLLGFSFILLGFSFNPMTMP